LKREKREEFFAAQQDKLLENFKKQSEQRAEKNK
jgi:hypothetical protein